MALNNEQTNRNDTRDSIHGWLTVFLVFCCIGGVLTLFSNVSYIDLNNNIPGYGWLVFGDILSWFFHAGICFYTVDSFMNRRNTAVFWGKCTLATYLLSNIIVLLNGEYPFEWIHSIGGVLFALVWGVVWFVYLCKSEQVNRLIPKDVQKPQKKQWIILSMGLVLPMLVAITGFLCSFK